jgi:two-component system sensor histidine kinase UhpB
MWRSISLSHRLNLIFASLFALWLAVDAGHVVFQASARARAETQSAMRLTRDFVETTLARLQVPPPPATIQALVASLQNLRHVRTGVGESSIASAIMQAANNESDAPRWFRALVNARSEVAAVPVTFSDGKRESIIIVADPSDEIDEVWAGARDRAAVGGLVALVALGVMSLLVGRALTPLGVAGLMLARLEAGDYAARAEGGGPPEIRDLNAKINSLAQALGALNRANGELLERVFDAQDEERRLIAHELHDELGPHLFALRAGAGVLAGKIGGDPAARAAASAARPEPAHSGGLASGGA